jgi:hypothetical protein
VLGIGLDIRYTVKKVPLSLLEFWIPVIRILVLPFTSYIRNHFISLNFGLHIYKVGIIILALQYSCDVNETTYVNKRFKKTQEIVSINHHHQNSIIVVRYLKELVYWKLLRLKLHIPILDWISESYNTLSPLEFHHAESPSHLSLGSGD